MKLFFIEPRIDHRMFSELPTKSVFCDGPESRVGFYLIIEATPAKPKIPVFNTVKDDFDWESQHIDCSKVL